MGSDFAANLAKENTQESDAAAAYEKTTDANKIEKATVEQDVKYKTQEFKGLDKTVAELSSDRDTVHKELDGVNDYSGKLTRYRTPCTHRTASGGAGCCTC